VIITWPASRGLRGDNCVNCFFRITATLDRRRSYYTEKYGVYPRVKAGLHIGEATVGEIGVIKKDIVYSGDVLNTTSRIQGECNKYGMALLISSELLDCLSGLAGYTVAPIGEIQLRGKTETVRLHSVVAERDPAL